MRKALCLTMILMSLGVMAGAQNISSKPQITIDPRYNEKTIVRDSNGVQYDYTTWSKYYYSGVYTLKQIRTLKPNAQPEYMLYKPTAADVKRYGETFAKPKESKYFKTGELIEPFKTHDINGNKISLKDLRGKVVVLDFWFINNCRSCQFAIPELNNLVNDYKDNKDIVFVAIALDDINSISQFVKQMRFDYQIVDSGQDIADKYKIKLYPTHVVIDKEGRVRFHYAGNSLTAISWIRKTIEEYK